MKPSKNVENLSFNVWLQVAAGKTYCLLFYEDAFNQITEMIVRKPIKWQPIDLYDLQRIGVMVDTRLFLDDQWCSGLGMGPVLILPGDS